MSQSSDCVFCKIVAGEFQAATFFESCWSIAFLDIAPVALCHALVVPKLHYESLAEMPASVVAAVMSSLPDIVKSVQEVSGVGGVNVLLNNGAVAGQVVPHVHWHIIPRHANDGFRFPWPRMQYAAGQAADFAGRLRAALAG